MTESERWFHEQANRALLMAEQCRAVAAKFRPRYEACWQNKQLIDQDTALRLRPFVIKQEQKAKGWEREAIMLITAARVISVCETFIKRVDEGSARSTKTYTQMKDIIETSEREFHS